MKTITTGNWEGSAGGLKANHSLPAHHSNYKLYGARNVGDIIMHYTGNERDTAKGNANYFHTGYRAASAHFFVDEDSIFQSVALCNVAWHFSADSEKEYFHPTCRNANSIGIEMCTIGNYKVSEKTKENGAQLCAAMCRLINIPADQVDEHVFRHWDMTRKNCPAQMAGEGNQEWAAFKARVKQILEEDDEMLSYEQFEKYMERYNAERAKKPVADWAKSGVAKVEEAKIMSRDSSGNFRAQSFITRQEAAVSQAAILRRIEEVDKRVDEVERRMK